MWCGGFSKPKIMGGDRFIEKLVSTNSSQQDICIIGFQDAKKVEKSQSSTKRPLSFKQLTLFPLKDSKNGSTSRSSIKKRSKLLTIVPLTLDILYRMLSFLEKLSLANVRMDTREIY